MSYTSYPSMAMHRASALLDIIASETLEQLRQRAGQPHPDTEPAISDTPATAEQIKKISDGIRALADENGYPEPLPRAAVREFDRPAGEFLHDTMNLSPREAARPETWNYITLVQLPDVAAWRFPSRESYRMMGAGFGPKANRRGRNAFGRLWWAVEVLGDQARLGTADGEGPPLGEDEIVGIMERTAAIAPSPMVARSFARNCRIQFEANSSTLGVGRMDFFRSVAKRITWLRALYNVSALSEPEVDEVVLEACRLTIGADGP